MAFTLSVRRFTSKDAFPTGTWTMPAFSTRNSTLPAFASRTARVTSAVRSDGVHVVGEALHVEGRLPDRDVDDAGLLDAELHLARLRLAHGPGHVGGEIRWRSRCR